MEVVGYPWLIQTWKGWCLGTGKYCSSMINYTCSYNTYINQPGPKHVNKLKRIWILLFEFFILFRVCDNSLRALSCSSVLILADSCLRHPQLSIASRRQTSKILDARESLYQPATAGSIPDNASPTLLPQHFSVLQGHSQCSRHLSNGLSRRLVAPDPKCLHPGQPRQRPQRHAQEEASRSRSLVRPWKDFWTRS